MDPIGRKAKKAKSNAKSNAKNNAKNKANGQRAIYNAKNNAKNKAKNNAKATEKRKAATHAAIEACKDQKEKIWNPDEIHKNANLHMAKIDKVIAEEKNFVVHHFNGSYAHHHVPMTAAETESCKGSSARGGGTPSFVWKDGSFVTFRELKRQLGEKVMIILAYKGTNQANCDAMEKALHQRHISLPEDQRLFRGCGHGSCWPGKKTVAKGAPFPYYCATLLILCSLEEAGLRLGKKSDRGGKKRKRADDGAGASSKNFKSITSFFRRN